MKKLIIPILFFPFVLSAQTLQDVVDNGATTTTGIIHKSGSGIQLENKNITPAAGVDNAVMVGQHGSNAQFWRMVPYSTFDAASDFSKEMYYDFTNGYWGVDGEFHFENRVYLAPETSEGLHFGEGWRSYATATNSAFVITQSNTGGVELEIRDIDGDYTNSHTLVAGKLGVGVSVPSEKIEVAGNLKFNTLNSDLIFQDDATHIREANNNMEYIAHGSHRFYIDENNNSTGARFQVYGAVAEGTTSGSLLSIDVDGNVGIGVDDPTQKLDVRGKVVIDATAPLIDQRADNTSSSRNLWALHSKTDEARKWGQHFGTSHNLIWKKWSGTAGAETSQTWLVMDYADNIVRFESVKVGIGTDSPTEELEVNGTIRSKEVKVEASLWPDYVFASDYELMSLKETEAFIQQKGHLPHIPSAEEVETNGIAVGEMNARLLEKIEELTLHQIELLKMVESQQVEIDRLKSSIDSSD